MFRVAEPFCFFMRFFPEILISRRAGLKPASSKGRRSQASQCKASRRSAVCESCRAALSSVTFGNAVIVTFVALYGTRTPHARFLRETGILFKAWCGNVNVLQNRVRRSVKPRGHIFSSFGHISIHRGTRQMCVSLHGSRP